MKYSGKLCKICVGFALEAGSFSTFDAGVAVVKYAVKSVMSAQWTKT